MEDLDLRMMPEGEPSSDGESSTEGEPASEGGSPSTIQDDDHMIEMYKDFDLYLAVKNGSVDAFSSVLGRASAAEQVSIADILRRLSPAGNTFLHIAAKHGNEAIVTYIAAKDSSLVLCKNSNGETALHLAAKGGHESTVKALVQVCSSNEADHDNLLRAEDERGNTALHTALIHGWESVAEYLIQEDPAAPYYQNKIGESALYLAAEADSVKCVASILRHSIDQERIEKQFKKKSPIEAAIMGKNTDVLEAMLSRNPSVFQLRDGEGRIPLHYAAASGHLEAVLYLLDRSPLTATQRDKYGSLPIHIASIHGHVDIIHILLKDFPDPGALLDRDGCNILHLAAANGRFIVVRYILKNSDLAHLINMKDKNGNTPLHLAARHGHPKIVSFLIWDRRVDLSLVNDKGMTALDAAEYCRDDNPEFRQRLTWAALTFAGVPWSLSSKTVGRPNPKKSPNMENYKEMANTLTLVATLVATVTFAAAFNVPGGYNSSDTDLGIATILRDKTLHVFIFCDAIALYSSILAVVALLWFQIRDLILGLNALIFAMSMVLVALWTMSMALMAGIFLVVNKIRWLGIAVVGTGITFLTILFVIFLALLIPVAPRNRILRHICYYPFYWLVIINERQLATAIYCVTNRFLYVIRILSCA